jgi:hypothetical protein
MPPPHWPEVLGILGAGGFPYGERMAPNGRAFDPLFALDLDFNVGLLADQRLYLFTTSSFWTERPGSHTNPSQGIFDFSKREWDFSAGLAWNIAGPAELRVFGYALNNLNRGVSVTMPSGYADGVGIEGRLYLPTPDRYDIAKRGFLAVGYLPSKVLIDANGCEFAPGLFARAYLTYDLPAVRSYLFGDAEAITDDDLSLRVLYGDAGLAARPCYRPWNFAWVLPTLTTCVCSTTTGCWSTGPSASSSKSRVLLDRLCDRLTGSGQVIRDHDWAKRDARIEGEEPRFRERRNLRRVLHLQKEKPRALTVVVGKVHGLRL